MNTLNKINGVFNLHIDKYDLTKTYSNLLNSNLIFHS